MKKQILLFLVAFAFVLTIIGASSATTNVNTAGTQYKTGQKVTEQAMADTNLNMKHSNKNLLITTASTAKLNGKTTEDSVQAVVDKTSTLSNSQKITYGSGNLLTINDPNGQLWFAFVSNTNGVLKAKKFTISQTGTITPGTTVDISSTQTNAKFKNAIAALGSNGFNIANIANLWAAGAPADLMALTYTNGGINQGTIDNYAETKTFALKYTNPTTGAMSGSNYVITTAGGLDDDAPFYGALGFNDIFFSTRGTAGETAFINYNTVNGARSGVLALMKGNDLTSQFGTVTPGTLSEIQFNLWLLNQLQTSPQDLFSVLASKNVNEDNIKYLWYDASNGYGHGIDENYINGLTNVVGGWNPITNVVPLTDYDGMYALGQDAFNYAYNTQHLFTADDLANGRVAVSLAPYYVNHLGTRSLVGFIDGVVRAANGALVAAGYSNAEGFTIDNILSIRNPWMWSTQIPAIFITTTQDSIQAYTQHHGENLAMNYLVMNAVKSTYTYNSNTGSYQTTRASADMSPAKIQSGGFLGSFIIPAPAGLLYAWSAGAPYNYLRTIARVGCICSTKEYDLATILQGQYPLGPNEHYILTVLTAQGESNRQISGRTTAWGVSPGQGTYYSVGQTSNSAYQLIVTIWNDVTQTGKSMLIAYDATILQNAMNADGYTIYAQENDLFWHLDKVWNNGPEAGVVTSAISTTSALSNMNQDFLNALNAAGADPIEYVLNYNPPSVAADTPTGLYNTDRTVTLASEPGTTVYYTLDGTTPTTNSLIYTGPITISKTTTLQYIAVQGRYFSPVYIQTYTIDKVPPTVTSSNPTGTYKQDQTITLTTEPGVTIYYTLDGTTPTTNSLIYTGPITITKTTTLQYIAVDQAGNISPIYTQTYTIDKTPIEPNNPTNPTTPVSPANPIDQVTGTISSALETIGTSPTTTTEIAPGLPTGQTNPTTTPTNTGTNTPIGEIIGAIILAIAALLIYLARNTITATLKRTEKPGK